MTFALFEAFCSHQENETQFFIHFLQWISLTVLWFSMSYCAKVSGKQERAASPCRGFSRPSRSCFRESGWQNQERCIPELQNAFWAFSQPCTTGEGVEVRLWPQEWWLAGAGHWLFGVVWCLLEAWCIRKLIRHLPQSHLQFPSHGEGRGQDFNIWISGEHKNVE